jgi:hypothetical protein
VKVYWTSKRDGVFVSAGIELLLYYSLQQKIIHRDLAARNLLVSFSSRNEI